MRWPDKNQFKRELLIRLTKPKDASCIMSLENLVNQPGLKDVLEAGQNAYQVMGLKGPALQRAIELTFRFMVHHTGTINETSKRKLFKAIGCIVSRELPSYLAGKATPAGNGKNHNACPSSTQSSPRDPSIKYWIDRVCTSIEIDTWLDDSLEKWYIDSQHPFKDYFIHVCKNRVMSLLLGSALHDNGPDADELVQMISNDLESKFPELRRFTKHLPHAISTAMEHDILGVPLHDRQPTTTPVPSSILEPAGVQLDTRYTMSPSLES